MEEGRHGLDLERPISSLFLAAPKCSSVSKWLRIKTFLFFVVLFPGEKRRMSMRPLFFLMQMCLYTPRRLGQ